MLTRANRMPRPVSTGSYRTMTAAKKIAVTMEMQVEARVPVSSPATVSFRATRPPISPP